jgi:uncharacterized protein
MIFLLVTLVGFLLDSNCFAAELPPLEVGINDFAGMFPPASADDLKERLHRFKTETAVTVVVLTVKSLDGEELRSLSAKAFQSLPVGKGELTKTVLLVVARKERLVALEAGADLRQLLPEPITHDKLHAHVALYWDGMRPDLGIHGAVHYLFGVIRGDVRAGSQTEAEKLQDTSLRGGEAGAIFAFCVNKPAHDRSPANVAVGV